MPSHPKIKEINEAIKNKDHVAMKHLLEANPDIDPKKHIHYAVQVSNEPVVRTLLEHPNDFKSREAVANHIQTGDESGDTPLGTALQREDLDEGKEIIRTLLQPEFRADPYHSAPRGMSAMDSLNDDLLDTEDYQKQDKMVIKDEYLKHSTYVCRTDTRVSTHSNLPIDPSITPLIYFEKSHDGFYLKSMYKFID